MQQVACQELAGIITAANTAQISPALALYISLSPVEPLPDGAQCSRNRVDLTIKCGKFNNNPTYTEKVNRKIS